MQITHCNNPDKMSIVSKFNFIPRFSQTLLIFYFTSFYLEELCFLSLNLQTEITISSSICQA